MVHRIFHRLLGVCPSVGRIALRHKAEGKHAISTGVLFSCAARFSTNALQLAPRPPRHPPHPLVCFAALSGLTLSSEPPFTDVPAPSP